MLESRAGQRVGGLAVRDPVSKARTVARIEDKVRLGPDAQVDDKAVIIAPRDPRATDPFLALAEDWFSEPGFEWHPHRGIETGYQDLRASSRPAVTRSGVVIDVVSGAIPAPHRAFLYVLEGEVTIGGRRVRDGQVAWSDPAGTGASSLRIVAAGREEPARVLAYSGTPLREPVVLGGPFVMNSRAEIERAYQDYRAGRFGQVPRQARGKRT